MIIYNIDTNIIVINKAPIIIKYINISIILLLLIAIINFSKTVFTSPNRKFKNIEFNIIKNPVFLLGIAFNNP